MNNDISFYIIVSILLILEIYIISNLLRKKKNKVHFYVTKDKNGVLILWFGKPKRAVLSELWYGCDEVRWITYKVSDFHLYNLNPKDFDNLKWEDEPLEVFLNLEK